MDQQRDIRCRRPTDQRQGRRSWDRDFPGRGEGESSAGEMEGGSKWITGLGESGGQREGRMDV